MAIPFEHKAIILNLEDESNFDETMKELAPVLSKDASSYLNRMYSNKEKSEFQNRGSIILAKLGIAIIYPDLLQMNRFLDDGGGDPTKAKLKYFQNLKGVRSASFDQEVELCAQWDDNADFTWGIQATKVDKSDFTGRGISVGVIDSGIDFNDTNLMSNVKEGRNFTFLPECRDDQAAVANRNLARYLDVWDERNHGTPVSSVISLNRGLQRRRYSVAPDADIYIAKGAGLVTAVYRAMNWLADKNVDIINMSFRTDRNILTESTKETMDSVCKALLDLNILPIAAVGNDSWRNRIIIDPVTDEEVEDPIISPIGYPAASEYCLGVGAIDQSEKLSSYSNGYVSVFNESVNIVGPGDFIEAAGTCDEVLPQSGTSIACPYVSGVAALWAQKDKKYRGRALMKKILKEAKDLGGGDFGEGLVQAP